MQGERTTGVDRANRDAPLILTKASCAPHQEVDSVENESARLRGKSGLGAKRHFDVPRVQHVLAQSEANDAVEVEMRTSRSHI